MSASSYTNMLPPYGYPSQAFSQTNPYYSQTGATNPSFPYDFQAAYYGAAPFFDQQKFWNNSNEKK